MDCYYCPAGFMLPFTRIQKRDDEPDLKLYVCNNCSICIMKNACTKAKNRTISRDPRIHLLEDMRKKLKSEEGKEVYQSRMYTVEPVFGQMKQNRGFREFLLRGKEKVKVEFVMMCIVHNIEKIGNFIKKHKKNLKTVLGNGINESNIAKNIAIKAKNSLFFSDLGEFTLIYRKILRKYSPGVGY